MTGRHVQAHEPRPQRLLKQRADVPQRGNASELVDVETPQVGSERSAVPAPRKDVAPLAANRALGGQRDRLGFLALTPLIATRVLEISPLRRRRHSRAASIR